MLYMLVGINMLFSRLKEYSCETQEFFASSVFVRHIYNLIGVFFLLVLFTRTQPLMHPVALLGVALLIYGVFLLMTRCDHRFLVASVVALAGVFFLEAWVAYYAHRLQAAKTPEEAAVAAEGRRRIEGELQLMRRAQYVLEAFIIVAVAVGCVVYIGQHSREYADSWSWKTFWLGTTDNKCKMNGSGEAVAVRRDLRDGARRLLGRAAGRPAKKRVV